MTQTFPTNTFGGPASLEGTFAEVLADVLGTEQVPVDSHFFDDLGADSLLMARFCARARKHADLPSVSMKDVYANPTIGGLAAALGPQTRALERSFAEVLADVLGTEQVPVDSHFFDDLGADSLLMARFCARARKHADLPSVSMKDVYANPTISRLAAALSDTASATTERWIAAPGEAARTSTRRYVTCAALQALIFLGYAYLSALVFERAILWVSAGGDLAQVYVRSVGAGAATFLLACTLPILAKWVLVGRWMPQQFPVWSLPYLRFWLVKTLVAANPLVLFAGSPLYSLYLRALGANVGRGTVVFSRHAPICTDLLTIGAGTVIRKDAYLNCYRAHGGMIQIGAVGLGRDVFVGEKAVLDIGTSMGDGAQLGHGSSLHAGQVVPAGERWHGSPGQRTDAADYRGVGPVRCSTRRRVTYTVVELLNLLLVILPLAFGGATLLLVEVPWVAALMGSGPLAFLTSWTVYGIALVVSLVLFFGSKLVAMLFVFTVPRVLNLLIRPDKVYPLYGFHYSVHRTIARLTNRKFFHEVLGDSSYIVYYLRGLGYKLSPIVQTGSNFGNEVKHENPYLCSVGSGTVVASGLVFINTDYSSTSFRLAQASIGSNNFLGNEIVYSPQGRTGENCLLATKVLVPIDGEVREGVGLLGSPAFEIPRTVARDSKFADTAHGDDFPRLLAAKNQYNLATLGWSLLARWFYYFLVTLIGFIAVDFYDTLGAWTIALGEIVVVVVSVFYLALLERASTRFRGLQPTHCSIYVIDFWRTERFFKFCARVGLHRIFNGTPFKAVLWRLVGVRLGKRLFDDGTTMAEKNLVTIGDDVTLNAGSGLQCHSQEDYAFKSDRITIGTGCTVGVGAMAHYGVTMGAGAMLAADSFLMKGEEVPPHERWGGNPAREMPTFDPLAPRPTADAHLCAIRGGAR